MSDTLHARRSRAYTLLVVFAVAILLAMLRNQINYLTGASSLWIALPAAYALVWIATFVRIMLMRDTDFPGRHDKLIWAAALILLQPIGLIALFICDALRGSED